MYKVIGKSCQKKEDGSIVTTLHVSTPFSDYYQTGNRFSEGQSVESIYVRDMDCSKIPVGAEIEIFYAKAVPTRSGGYFQPISDIQIVKS